MSSFRQSVTLLRMNKRAQVAALQELGFNVTNDMRASEFPKYAKWAGGLLDVTIAATRKSDGAKLYYTKEEWLDLTGTVRSGLLVRGVRVRADGLSFIISGEQQQLQWGAHRIVTDMPSLGGGYGAWTFRDARARTEAISEFYEGVSADGVVGAPAADFCLAFKAFTAATDGIDDDTEWSLPCVCHLLTMYRHRAAINEVIDVAWDSSYELASQSHWSCIQYDATNAFNCNPCSSYLYSEAKNGARYVRPIAAEN